MPIKDVQKRLTQVGVIRLGEQRVSGNGKNYPAKLETLRFTSPSRNLIDAIAARYGGSVKPWEGQTGPEWEVITTVKEIPVLVPPQRIDPNMEHWGPGFRDRLCDGETEMMRSKPCLCATAAADGRPFGPRDLCKPTTRMSLMLADIPSLGTWKLEARGWNGAAELPSLADSVENAPFPVPARLVMQVREKKVFDPSKSGDAAIEPRTYVVPVVLFDWLTPAQAFGGELGAAARAALGAATTERRAIEATKTRRRFTPEQYLTLAESAEEIADVRELWTDAKDDGSLTDKVKQALNRQAAKIKAPKSTPEPQPPAPASEPEATPGADDVVDAEVEPTADEVWAQILPVAGAKGWNTEALERQVNEFLGKPAGEANGFELTRFLAVIKAADGAR